MTEDHDYSHVSENDYVEVSYENTASETEDSFKGTVIETGEHNGWDTVTVLRTSDQKEIWVCGMVQTINTYRETTFGRDAEIEILYTEK